MLKIGLFGAGVILKWFMSVLNQLQNARLTFLMTKKSILKLELKN